MKRFLAAFLALVLIGPLELVAQTCLVPSGGVVSKTANYSPLAADTGKLFAMSCPSACTVTLPSPPPTSIYAIWIKNVGPGIVTISNNGLMIDGVTSSIVMNDIGAVISITTDGTNYFQGAFSGQTTSTFQVGISRGANNAPAFTGSNYTVNSWTEASGSMTVNHTGANSFTPASALTIIPGQTYEIDLVSTTYTSGAFTVSLGGVTSPSVTPAASNQYRFYVTATSTASPSLSAAATGLQSFAFSSFSVKRAAYDPNSLANIPIIIDTNAGLSVPLTVYQPPALAGWTFQENVIAAQTIVDKSANGSDVWFLGTSSFSSTISLPATREFSVTLVCYANATWDTASLNGSVTFA